MSSKESILTCHCALMHLDLLNSIFNQIYDLKIVKEEEFQQWRDQGTENFGKGATVATVMIFFFDWLDRCETESEDDTQPILSAESSIVGTPLFVSILPFLRCCHW